MWKSHILPYDKCLLWGACHFVDRSVHIPKPEMLKYLTKAKLWNVVKYYSQNCQLNMLSHFTTQLHVKLKLGNFYIIFWLVFINIHANVYLSPCLFIRLFLFYLPQWTPVFKHCLICGISVIPSKDRQSFVKTIVRYMYQ